MENEQVGTTIYFDTHQRVYFDLSPLTMSGATREACDEWMRARGAEVEALKQATEIVKSRADISVEELIEDVETIDQFITTARELDS